MSKNGLKRVAIIGGGPAGLTLARILQCKGIDVKVYERENSINDRSQGGTLDLHPESGQYALRTAGLFDKFEALCRPEGQNTRVMDKSGVLYTEEVADESRFDRPEIDRRDLRQLLLESLKADTIVQGYNLQSIEPLTNGQHKLRFDNSVTETVDLVVGADGAWSRVRPLVSSAKPKYCGVTMVDVQFSEVDDRQPEISKLVGRGSIFIFSDNKGFIAQRNGYNTIRVYIAIRVPENWITESGIDFDQPEQVRPYLLQLFADWDESLLKIIHCCDDNFVPRPLYMLPIDHQWETKEGVTLLGDAAHLMSPYAGQGVNIAMHDAVELALAMSGTDDWFQAIHSYEQKMFPRAAEAAQQSLNNFDLVMSPGNRAAEMAAILKAMMEKSPPGEQSSDSK